MPQVDYSKIVIYKIQHKEKDELLYVGSTTHFRNRKVNHKSKCYNTNNKIYNNKLYTTIRDNGGWDAFNMVVIKEFPCKNKQEALTEEDRVMREMLSSLNMLRAYQPPKERRNYLKEYEQKDKTKEIRKKYRENNKPKIKEYSKNWHEVNKDKIKERKKKYREQNKDKRKEYNKIYREQNKEKSKEQTQCDCGCIITKINLTRHKLSIKHQTLINQQTDQ